LAKKALMNYQTARSEPGRDQSYEAAREVAQPAITIPTVQLFLLLLFKGLSLSFLLPLFSQTLDCATFFN